MSPMDEERLERLERELSELRADVQQLFDERRTAAGPAVQHSPPLFDHRRAEDAPSPSAPTAIRRPPGTPPPPPPLPPLSWKLDGLFAESRRSGASVEELVGRYGTLAAGTVTVLVGAGTFLSWAIRKGLLVPEVRVALGFLSAMALAAVGHRLRTRSSREFGNALLGLSLAVVHLVCWSAGPLLHVLPSIVALAIAVAASAALVEFARRTEEQALSAIGFGGAALAPFVTGEDTGSVVLLTAYGIAVLSFAMAAIGPRPWTVVRRVMLIGFTAYLVTATTPVTSATLFPEAAKLLPPLYGLLMLLAAATLASPRHQRAIVRYMAVALAVVLVVWNAARGNSNPLIVLLTLASAIVVVVSLERTKPSAEDDAAGTSGTAGDRDSRRPAFDGAGIPLVFLMAAVTVAPRLISPQSAVTIAVWAALTLAAAWWKRGRPEGAYYAVASATSFVLIVPAALADHVMLRAAGAAAMGLVLIFVALRAQREAFIGGAAVSLIFATVWSFQALGLRPIRGYTPFATPETLLPALTAACWWIAGRVVSREQSFPAGSVEDRRLYAAIGMGATAIALFIWFRQELAFAWSRGVTAAVLTVYYGAAGVIVTWIGRRQAVVAVRAIGLGLILLAAAKALVEAFRMEVGVRIAVFFVVSAFLIGVGYWYRRRAAVDEEKGQPRVAPS